MIDLIYKEQFATTVLHHHSAVMKQTEKLKQELVIWRKHIVSPLIRICS